MAGFEFEWDEAKADANARKRGIAFELAASVFFDPRPLTAADVEHSDIEQRWFSVGLAGNGVLLSVTYLWSDIDPDTTTIRLISARKATKAETSMYKEGL